MEDFGIVYIIENAQQFWSELEDILRISEDASLGQLDATLSRFVSFCATYHEQYLQSPIQLEHACSLLLQCDLFTFHSERMRERLLEDAEKTTDPHGQLILFQILLQYGRNHPSFLRSQKKWAPLLPLLMDYVLLDFDPEVEDLATSSGWNKTLPTPIEANLRILAVGILYEVCRVQKFSLADLRVFDDAFIDFLFDLVEQTRHMQDEALNYSLIKLIVALNEQFMVATVSSSTSSNGHKDSKHLPAEQNNRVLRVLMLRLNSSKTFGENMIFMLNRAGRTPEDLCMQLLVLKILYLLFTTKGTTEYFYTNDLRVLVDVFLRELVDLDEDSESLRHTYLRVLHPLLTRTQLRSVPYKRPQVVRTLESLISHSSIRDINPTTKRLVERCLSGDWCVQLRRVNSPGSDTTATGFSTGTSRGNSPGVADTVSTAKDEYIPTSSPDSPHFLKPRERQHSIKASKSVENLRKTNGTKGKTHGESYTKHGNASVLNLQSIGAALPATSLPVSPTSPITNVKLPQRASTLPDQNLSSSSSASLPSSVSSLDQLAGATSSPKHPPSISRVHSHQGTSSGSTPAPPAVTVHSSSLGQVVDSIVSPTPVQHSSGRSQSSMSGKKNFSYNPSSNSTSRSYEQERQRRSAPPTPPPKRRKPPAIPVEKTARTAGGATMMTIASSSVTGGRKAPSPLSRVHPVNPS
ncbi:uncharacterized protein FOMMEDRAFT_147075 [Fomitiporia mediterranea MF3/22]|uniref:uncharacterized protein n=1 Tax=Fomitiporia mediterranea (strain MF3/22) TaxID=694068 RepID=UPI0004407CD0|nr:uncharacterized protein FOMMEDRAFT_147075 [Fomitiporia mediterranea MF3/22]EJD01900.1 hypothetical protein FOMMEDRAFT_147075 [Fomitiporia mediterranea MF3/22]